MSAGRGPVVNITVTGDSTPARKAFDEVGDSAKSMGKKVEQAAEGFDNVRDAADNSERRIMGFRDGITGTGDVMKGIRDGDMLTFATGLGDLASSVANLGADLLDLGKKIAQNGVAWVKSSAASVAAKAKDIAASVAHKAATIASTVATQAQAAAQWVLNAAMTANPVLLVVAGLAALVAAFVIAWKNSETFREIVTGAFDKVKAVAEAVWNWVSDNWPLLLAILTGPFGLAVLAIVKHRDKIIELFTTVKAGIETALAKIWSTITDPFYRAFSSVRDFLDDMKDAFVVVVEAIGKVYAGVFNAIARAWNNTVGALSFSVPDWVPIMGGKGWDVPNIPEVKLASGGIVTSPTRALIGEAGPEAVIPLDRLGQMGTINVYMPPGSNGQDVVDALTRWQRRNGALPFSVRG